MIGCPAGFDFGDGVIGFDETALLFGQVKSPLLNQLLVRVFGMGKAGILMEQYPSNLVALFFDSLNDRDMTRRLDCELDHGSVGSQLALDDDDINELKDVSRLNEVEALSPRHQTKSDGWPKHTEELRGPGSHNRRCPLVYRRWRGQTRRLSHSP